MWIVPGLALASALLGATDGKAPAPAAQAARALIDAAIQAGGGPERLVQTQAMARKGKGVIVLFGQEVPLTDELVWQLPQRWRASLEAGPPGQAVRAILVVNGDQGWQVTGGATMPLGKERLAELREQAYVWWLATLLPLKKESGFQVTPLPEAKVDGQPAVGVKVTRPGHADVKLYFDRRTHLLAKAEHRVREGGVEVDKEYLYRAYRPLAGVPLPTQYAERNDGKKFVELSSVRYEFRPRLDEAVFARP